MPRKVYTPEFRETAVRLASQPDASIPAIARELGVSIWTLRQWIKQAAKPPATRQEESDLRTRLRKLEAEVRQLRMERDILKKATAFFAKEQP